MSEVLFDVVFKGKHGRSVDRSTAIAHFAKLFKLPVNKAEQFFDGQPRTLKKALAMEKASHFRTVLKKAGIRVSLVKQDTQDSVQKRDSELTMSEPGVVLVNKPFIQPQPINTSHFSLDEAGALLVQFKPVEKIEFDLQGLHIEELGAQIVEKQTVEALEIDTTDFVLDEVGAVFAEKQSVQAVEYDISTLSLDEVGAVIVDKKPIEALEINTDDIQLEE